MTYEELYRHELEAYLNDPANSFEVNLPPYDKNDGAAIKRCLTIANTVLEKLLKSTPQPLTIDFNARIEEIVAPKRQQYEAMMKTGQLAYDKALADATAQHDAAIAEAERVANESVSGLTKMYDQLLTYRDKISAAVVRYNIKPSDLDLDADNLTREDMEALVSQALESCKYISDSDFRNKLAMAYTPADGDHDTRVTHAIAVVAIALLLAPVAFLAMFFYMGWNCSHIYKHVEGIRIADKLMYGINFDRFRDKPKTEEVPDIDLSVEEAKIAELKEKAKAFDPEPVVAELQRLLADNSEAIDAAIQGATAEVKARYKSTIEKVSQYRKDADVAYSAFLANRKAFCDVGSQSYTLNYEAVLGLQDEVVEHRYPVLDKNIIFASNDPGMVDFQKLLLANMLLNVRPRQLEVTIFDPDRLGQDYALFLSDSTKDYIHVETKKLSDIIDSLREYSQTNFRILGDQDIAAFNSDAESKGKVTREYKLLIVAAYQEEIFKNRSYIQFMQTCVRSGVHVWCVGPEPIEGLAFYRTPFEGVEFPYPVSNSLWSKVTQTYLDTLANSKDKGILYVPSFQEKYMPRENWWKENCDKGIKLNFGLQDGDPSKGYDIMLGDANVHGLCAGATGAGKSAFINQLLATLVTRYPPSALELILIDFKNIEFPSLCDQTTHLSRIPHARVIAGTKDGEYAISIFDYMLKEMEERNRRFAPTGAKKLEEYNTYMRNQGTPEKCMPRVLILIDEFQVMFTEVEPKSVEVIQSRIRSLAKLARNAGVHMFFTSQSMKGTMPKDILDQFSLRVCLRASSDTSTSIIGSPIASRIKSKFGYLYTNTNMGETQDSTTLWRTPFIPNEDWYDDAGRADKIAKGKLPAGSKTILTEICEMSETMPGEKGFRAYLYDAKATWPDSQLKTWFSEHADIVSRDPYLFVLGERTGYDTNKVPVNFRLTQTDAENILVYAREPVHLNDLIMTLVDNVLSRPENLLLMNVADMDVWNILDTKSLVPPEMVELSKPMNNVVDWIEFLETTIANRKENGMEGKRPIFFFAVRWDKQLGVYRDADYRLEARWKDILMNGPSVGVHTILAVSLYREITTTKVTPFNHRICGKGDADAGYKFIESPKIEKFDDEESPMAIYSYGTDQSKFKIYQHTYSREAQKRELVIE